MSFKELGKFFLFYDLLVCKRTVFSGGEIVFLPVLSLYFGG
jgi:hypothetical protein